MFRQIILVVLAAFYVSTAGATTQIATPSTSKIVVETKSGNLMLKDLIEACDQIAQSKPSKFVNRQVVGSLITMHDQKYEIRYFSFEDTTKKLPQNITFKEYVNKNSISDMKGSMSSPLKGIDFESFDFRRANLKDGVYFSMAVRLVNEKDLPNDPKKR